MKIIAKIDFGFNGDYYVQGDELKGLTYEQIVQLNELGYIEPLSFKDLILVKRELEKEKEDL